MDYIKRKNPSLSRAQTITPRVVHVTLPNLHRLTARWDTDNLTLEASKSDQFVELQKFAGIVFGFQPLGKFVASRKRHVTSLNPARNQDGDQIAILNADFHNLRMDDGDPVDTTG